MTAPPRSATLSASGVSRALAGCSLVGPLGGVRLMPVTGPRPAGSGGTHAGLLKARALGRLPAVEGTTTRSQVRQTQWSSNELPRAPARRARPAGLLPHRRRRRQGGRRRLLLARAGRGPRDRRRVGLGEDRRRADDRRPEPRRAERPVRRPGAL